MQKTIAGSFGYIWIHRSGVKHWLFLGKNYLKVV